MEITNIVVYYKVVAYTNQKVIVFYPRHKLKRWSQVELISKFYINTTLFSAWQVLFINVDIDQFTRVHSPAHWCHCVYTASSGVHCNDERGRCT